MPTPRITIAHLFRIVAFFILLALPLADYFFDLGLVSPRNENRVLAAFPGWSWDIEFLGEAPELYEAYVNDHIGIRFPRATPETETAPAEFHQYPPNLSLIFDTGITGTVKKFTSNSAGIRGPEFNPDSAIRILCIGGSTTQNHYLDDSKTWTHLLMVDLNRKLKNSSAWVGAAGIPGFTTTQHLQYLRTNESMRQYTHVVFVLGVNDLLFWLSFTPEGVQAGQPVVQSERTSTAGGGTPPALDERYNPIFNTMDVWQEFLENARKSRAQGTIVDEYPTPVRVLRGYRSRVEAIIDRCRELNIVPVFATHPVLWDKDIPPSAESRLWLGKTRTEGEYLSVSSLRELMDKYNETLTETCRARGAILVDASFLNGSPDAFVDDCHFSEYGAQLIAQRIADAILDSAKNSQPTAGVPN